MTILNKGFALIELMIAVAIIGALSAIALPFYSDYLTRSQVTEAVTLLGGLKIPVSEYANIHNVWPTAIISPPGVGVGATQVVGTSVGKYSRVTPVVVGAFPSGVMTATMISGKAMGKKISFTTADGGDSWACGVTTVGVSVGAAADTDIDAKYLPKACKP